MKPDCFIRDSREGLRAERPEGKGSADEEQGEDLWGLREQSSRQGRASWVSWGTEPRLICTRSAEAHSKMGSGRGLAI